MRVKLIKVYTGPTRTIQIDEVGDFSDSEGQALVNGKYGISLEPIKAKEIIVETMVIKPAENMLRPKNIKKKDKK